MVTKRKLVKRSFEALVLLSLAVYFYYVIPQALSQPPTSPSPQSILIVEFMIVGIFSMVLGVLFLSLWVMYRMKHGANLYEAWYGDGTLRTRKGKLVNKHGVVEYDIYVKFANGVFIQTTNVKRETFAVCACPECRPDEYKCEPEKKADVESD